MQPILLAFAVAASSPTLTDGLQERSGLIVSTVGESEWCPTGSVDVDLTTGRYLLTLRAPHRVCNQAGLKRSVKRGALSPSDLKRVRTAAYRFRTEGPLNPDCRSGHKPEGYIVISNGGPQQVTLRTEQAFVWAPEDLTCWSDAASGLHDTLENILKPNDWPR